MLESAGLTETERGAIEGALAAWSARVAAGRGSKAALDCVDRAAGRGSFAPCAEAAARDADPFGAGLAETLSACLAAGRGEFGAALKQLEMARDDLRPAISPDDPLWAFVHSTAGVLLTSVGRHEEAAGEVERALTLLRRLHGDDHPDVALNHLNLGLALANAGRGAEASAAFRTSLALHERAGTADANVAAYLGTAAATLLGAGDLAAAKQLFQAALRVSERVLPADHPALAVASGNLGETHLRLGEPAAALPLFERALAIRTEVQGADHPDTAVYLYKLGTAQKEAGDLAGAAKSFERMLAVYEKAHGPEHPHVSTALENLAEVRQKQTDYPAARALLGRVLVTFELLHGPDASGVATYLSKLAELDREIGDYEAAVPRLTRALAIWTRAHGPDHPHLAAGLVSQGHLRRDMGDFARARVAYERALEIYEKAHGPDHLHVATALGNVAALLATLGDHDAARKRTERALRIYLAQLGPTHAFVAVFTSNLALQHQALGDLETARSHAEQAVRIWSETLGPDHPQTAIGRNNLASILHDLGDLEAAKALLESVVTGSIAALGPDHPQVAAAIDNLGTALYALGDRAGAWREYERALKIRERSLGDNHRDVADSLAGLAVVHQAEGRTAKARELMGRAFAIAELSLGPLLDVTSERERIELVRSVRGYLDLMLSLYDRPDDAARTYRGALRWKAIVQRSLAQQRLALLAPDAPQERLDELAAVRSELAGHFFAPLEPRARELREETISKLTARKERLERKLAESSSALRRELSLLQTDVSGVCRWLAKDAALVDLVHYEHRRPGADEAAGEAEWTASYAAFVLRGGECERPVRVDLGPAQPIDAGVARLRELIQAVSPARRVARQARRVRAAVWDPIVGSLGDRTRVWVVPDAGLTGLPFAALVDEDGAYLVERYTLGYLPTATDLERLSEAPTRPGRGVLVAGGIDYATTATSAGEPAAASLTRAPPAGLLRDFGALQHTAKEATAVAKALSRERGVLRLTGSDATEGRLRKEIEGRRVVHLATHGFFATGEARSALAGDGSAGLNPMLLSGVVLAGVNARSGGAGDDGVLTAEEVVGLDLRGTRLVTLSACETGLGEVYSGEGVMGLRRAFALAGARALVMSLWKVPDAETLQLMRGFYSRVARRDDADVATMIRTAQLDLVHRLRKEHGEAHPFYWAAFIAGGR